MNLSTPLSALLYIALLGVTPGLPDALADDTSLRIAVEMDNDSAVKKMIQKGEATPDTRVRAPGYGAPGAPILALAAREGSIRVTQYLISAGADLNLRTPADETPLMLAAFFPDAQGDDNGSYEKHERVARLLVEAGASLDNVPGGFTPLSYSAYYNHIRISRYLLDRGAKVDDQPVNGRVRAANALMFASRNGHKDLVRLLLTRGADPRILDSRDQTAVSFAKANNQMHLMPLLQCALELAPGQSYSERCGEL